MGYFSNGTEGTLFQARYCNRCVHDRDEDCPIWMLHLSYNNDQSENPIIEGILSALIQHKGTDNICNLYHEKQPGEYSKKQELKRLEDWKNGRPKKV